MDTYIHKFHASYWAYYTLRIIFVYVIYELYAYKKELLDDGVISPIMNNENTDKPLVNFTAISSENFSKDIIFPYKSTWITPRFDV